MKVYRVNAGRGNLFWEEALNRGEILLYEDLEVFEAYQRHDSTNSITAAMKRCHQRYLRTNTSEGAFTSWGNLRSKFETSDGDLWLHMQENRIWWAISTSEMSVGDRRDIGSETGLLRPVVLLWKKTESGWNNSTTDGHRLTKGVVHPYAWRHVPLQGTFDQLNEDVATYFQALISGRDTTDLTTGAPWRDAAAKVGYRAPPKTSKEWSATMRRIWKQIEGAVARSGLVEERIIKTKLSAFRSEGEFMIFFEELRRKQGGKCIYTGLDLLRDDQNPSEVRASLDRIDSEWGYEPSNLQLVCQFINKMKSDTKHEDFLRYLELVRSSAMPSADASDPTTAQRSI